MEVDVVVDGLMGQGPGGRVPGDVPQIGSSADAVIGDPVMDACPAHAIAANNQAALAEIDDGDGSLAGERIDGAGAT